MGLIARAKDSAGNIYTVHHEFYVLRAVKKEYEKKKILSPEGEPLEFIDAVSDKDYHICKYCHAIVEGPMEDLLCDDCRELFGHALYSEL